MAGEQSDQDDDGDRNPDQQQQTRSHLQAFRRRTSEDNGPPPRGFPQGGSPDIWVSKGSAKPTIDTLAQLPDIRRPRPKKHEISEFWGNVPSGKGGGL